MNQRRGTRRDGGLSDILLNAFLHDIGGSLTVLEHYVSEGIRAKKSISANDELDEAASAAIEHAFSLVGAAKKAREGSRQKPLQSAELAATLNNIAKIVGAILAYKRVRFVSKIPPEFEFKCGVEVSYCELLVLIYNFMTNAMQAIARRMAEGSLVESVYEPTVSMTVIISGPAYSVEIKDNGCGMAASLLKEAQSESSPTSRGLLFAKSILNNVDGTLEIESNESGLARGTALRFRLPKKSDCTETTVEEDLY